MKVFAHRGSSGQYPENTMLAFSKAIEAGSDGIETDVHLSKDGEVMIIHDESLMRTAGIDEYVFNMTRGQLEAVSAGKTQDDRFGFTPVPSLEELLVFMEDHRDRLLNIELKTAPVYYPDIEEKVLELVSRHSLEENVIYSSFNWLSVIKIKRMNPQTRVGLLFSSMSLYNMGHIMRQLDVDCYHPDFHDLKKTMIDDFHNNGRNVNAWTVNEVTDIKDVIQMGVDGIITNWPERVLHEAGRC